MERRGVPAVEIIEEHFMREARSVAKGRGYDQLRFCVLPSAINTLTPDEVTKVADFAFEKSRRLLLHPEEAGKALKP